MGDGELCFTRLSAFRIEGIRTTDFPPPGPPMAPPLGPPGARGPVPLWAPYDGASLPIAFTRFWKKYVSFSGGFWFLSLIPLVGWIIILILTLMPSSPAGARFDHPTPGGS